MYKVIAIKKTSRFPAKLIRRPATAATGERRIPPVSDALFDLSDFPDRLTHRDFDSSDSEGK